MLHRDLCPYAVFFFILIFWFWGGKWEMETLIIIAGRVGLDRFAPFVSLIEQCMTGFELTAPTSHVANYR